MSYTKIDVRDVDDAAIRFGVSDTQEAPFVRRELAAEQAGLTYLMVKAEEVYGVLAGSGPVKDWDRTRGRLAMWPTAWRANRRGRPLSYGAGRTRWR
jgi:hypothetical protein